MRELILRYAARLGRPSVLDFLLPIGVPSPYDLARRRFRQRWTALIERVIAERRQHSAGDSHRDLFDLLAAGHSEGIDLTSTQRPQDQVATIIVAGHETTAAALFWSLSLIAVTPAEQDALAAEAEGVDLAPAGAADAAPQLVRTRAVVDEVLRLYPPAFVIVRQAVEDDIVAGLPIPARSLVRIAPWVLHRHRRVWRDPDTSSRHASCPALPNRPVRLHAVRHRAARLYWRTIRAHRAGAGNGGNGPGMPDRNRRTARRQSDRDRQHATRRSSSVRIAAAPKYCGSRVALPIAKRRFWG
jgi:Cytochrome P450